MLVSLGTQHKYCKNIVFGKLTNCFCRQRRLEHGWSDTNIVVQWRESSFLEPASWQPYAQDYCLRPDSLYYWLSKLFLELPTSVCIFIRHYQWMQYEVLHEYICKNWTNSQLLSVSSLNTALLFLCKVCVLFCLTMVCYVDTVKYMYKVSTVDKNRSKVHPKKLALYAKQNCSHLDVQNRE